jgi:hypothetical protein
MLEWSIDQASLVRDCHARIEALPRGPDVQAVEACLAALRRHLDRAGFVSHVDAHKVMSRQRSHHEIDNRQGAAKVLDTCVAPRRKGALRRLMGRAIPLLVLAVIVAAAVVGLLPGPRLLTWTVGTAAAVFIAVRLVGLAWGAWVVWRNPHARVAWWLAEQARALATSGANARALATYRELSALVTPHPREPLLPGCRAHAALALKQRAYPPDVRQVLDEDLARHIVGARLGARR